MILPADDPRIGKAVACASLAHTWRPAQAYWVPSSSGGPEHLTTSSVCSCKAFLTNQSHPCHHILAVQLLEEMAADPCQDLVLEQLPSGEFAWLKPEPEKR
jgi:hypothetical protein